MKCAYIKWFAHLRASSHRTKNIFLFLACCDSYHLSTDSEQFACHEFCAACISSQHSWGSCCFLHSMLAWSNTQAISRKNFCTLIVCTIWGFSTRSLAPRKMSGIARRPKKWLKLPLTRKHPLVKLCFPPTSNPLISIVNLVFAITKLHTSRCPLNWRKCFIAARAQILTKTWRSLHFFKTSSAWSQRGSSTQLFWMFLPSRGNLQHWQKAVKR